MPAMSPYKASVQKDFDTQRGLATSAENANLQMRRDALARRQAALGGGPGGAFIKAEQNEMNQSADRIGAANAQIGAAQNAEMRRIDELEQAQRIQREQFNKQHGLATQQFQFQKDQFGKQFDLANQQFALDKDKYANANNQWQSTFDFTKGQTDLENRETSRQNLLATLSNLKTMGYRPEQVGQIMNALGFDYKTLGIDPSLLGIEDVTVNNDSRTIWTGSGSTQKNAGTTNNAKSTSSYKTTFGNSRK